MSSKPQQRYDDIPKELRGLRNWVVWKFQKRTNKAGVVRITKPPYNARTGKLAKTNDPTTWSTFAEAMTALDRGGYDGLGICLTNRLNGADLDGCRSEDGSLEPWANEIVRKLDSYAEESPSKTGLKILVYGDIIGGHECSFGDREHHGIAIYGEGSPRYFTLTGRRVAGNGIIADRTAELRRIYDQYFGDRNKPRVKPQTGASRPDDDDLIEKARNANDGGKFARLWDGQWNGDYASQSEADLALCSKLAFWTNRDAGRIAALFRRSALMRDKWDRKDYREKTIGRAIEQTTETWTQPAVRAEKRRVLHVDAETAKPDVALLNSLAMFRGHVEFGWLRRRGMMIEAGFANGRIAQWMSATDLRTFARSQDILFAATGYLMPTPRRADVRAVWEPIAQAIRSVADADATEVEPPLKDEFRSIIRSTWRRAGRPDAVGREAFFYMLCDCQQQKRDHTAENPPECCVFIGAEGEQAEHSVWIYQEALVAWLSTPIARNKHYQWDEVRSALLQLDFKPRELHRSWKSEKAHVRIWQGPLSLLVDDDTEEDTKL
jgi:hypothetical protein